MNVLGFDFGLSHIGVAVGQAITCTATPLCILNAKEGQPNWQQVAELIAEWQPGYLVVGLPLNMDDSESEMSTRAKKFAARLHGRYGLRVEMCDERLSSFEAKQQTREQGGGGKEATVDAIAASLILQSWLQSSQGS